MIYKKTMVTYILSLRYREEARIAEVLEDVKVEAEVHIDVDEPDL